eukprot:gene1769-456_t
MRQEHLMLLAQLLGSDYATGVRNVGLGAALDIMATFPPTSCASTASEWLSGLRNFRSWMDASACSPVGGALNSATGSQTERGTTDARPAAGADLAQFGSRHKALVHRAQAPADFPSEYIFEAYSKALVHPTTDFSWREPDWGALDALAAERFGSTAQSCKDLLGVARKRYYDHSMSNRITSYYLRTEGLCKPLSNPIQAACTRLRALLPLQPSTAPHSNIRFASLAASDPPVSSGSGKAGDPANATTGRLLPQLVSGSVGLAPVQPSTSIAYARSGATAGPPPAPAPAPAPCASQSAQQAASSRPPAASPALVNQLGSPQSESLVIQAAPDRQPVPGPRNKSTPKFPMKAPFISSVHKDRPAAALQGSRSSSRKPTPRVCVSDDTVASMQNFKNAQILGQLEQYNARASPVAAGPSSTMICPRGKTATTGQQSRVTQRPLCPASYVVVSVDLGLDLERPLE